MIIRDRALVGALFVMTAPQQAWAQREAADAPADTDDTSAEEIVVTGYRGLTKSVGAIKLDSRQVVDTLTQREIERLPDRSLAEVLDRVVGVSSDRGFSGSAPRTVSLRGFDARYNSMEVDGNLIWNSSRNNRGTQLDVFPSSVINQINVFKTVTPDMDANSIGGHLELRTLRAFDGGTDSYVKARAAYGIYEQRGSPDDGNPSYRWDVAGKFTFGADRQFGVVLGAEYQQSEFFDRYNEVTGYSQIADSDVVNGNVFSGVFQSDQQRFAAFGKLETRSSDQYFAFLSASYFDDTLFQTFNRGGPFVTGTRVTNATAGRGDFTGGTGEVYFEDYQLRRQTTLIGTGLDYRVGERGSINLRGGYTYYDHNEVLFRSERFQVGSLAGSYDLTAATPAVTYNAASLALVTNPANWVSRTGRAAFNQPMPHRDNVYNASADFNLNNQANARGFGLRAGGYWRRLDRVYDQQTINFTIPTGTILRLSQVLEPRFAADPLTGTGPGFIKRGLYRTFLGASTVRSINEAPTNDYTLEEDVIAGHVAAMFATDNLKLLAGVRVEKTSFINGTANTVAGVIAPATRRFDYTEILPNAQASWEPARGIKLRLAYTEALGRPDFADFAPGLTESVNAAGARIVNGTNPFLEPRASRNYDASIEYYFDDGYVSLGVFHKRLRNETFRQVRETRDANNVITQIDTIPLNNGSAKVTGLELSVVKERFDFLPGPLAAFGINANYTLLEGEWNVIFNTGAAGGTRRTVDGLRNQPKWLGNVVLTYNTGPVGANVGYRLRGRTFTGSFGATEASDVWIDSYSRLDAQATLKLSKKLTVFGEARNLTDAYWVEQTGQDADDLSLSTSPGRSYWFGITLKM